MPRKAAELKPVQIARLRKPGLYAVGGVAGLHLRVSDTGARSWILRATIGPRRRDAGLGGFPDVTLADAREKARAFRAQAEQGVDPIEARRAAKAAMVGVLTFDEATKRFLAAKESEWSNKKHRAQWRATLKEYASPKLGRMPVDAIELRHVQDVLDPIWKTKTETATRLRARIESVLAWATASGYRSGDNPARWRGNLDAVMAKPGAIAKVTHMRALPYASVGAFMRDLRKREAMAARALEFLILTAARSGEVRGARWSEIDLKAKVWTIPAERMKAKREHRVPLTDRAVKILRELPRIKDVDLVFPAVRGGVLSDMTLTALLRRMKIPATAHGFRSTFRDFAAEKTEFPREIAEAALAHINGDKVEAAYRRSDFFDKRRALMDTWSAHCAKVAK